MKYKIGDRVRLNPKSGWAYQNDGEGTVIDIDHYDPYLPFMVEWDKAKRGEDLENYYAASDLFRVRKPKPKKPAGKRVDAVVWVLVFADGTIDYHETLARARRTLRVGKRLGWAKGDRIARCRLVEITKKGKVRRGA